MLDELQGLLSTCVDVLKPARIGVRRPSGGHTSGYLFSLHNPRIAADPARRHPAALALAALGERPTRVTEDAGQDPAKVMSVMKKLSLRFALLEECCLLKC